MVAKAMKGLSAKGNSAKRFSRSSDRWFRFCERTATSMNKMSEGSLEPCPYCSTGCKIRSMKPLTIGALASRAGVGVETIRFYERKGLVRRPPRPGRGFRVYPEDTVARIRFIRQAQTLGFTLQEIAGLLELRVTPGTDCAAVRTRAVAKVANVEARLAELERIRGALAKLIAACPGRGAVTTCTILGALAELADRTPEPARHRNAGVGT